METFPVQPSHALDAENHNQQCIFCLEEKPLTIEHVFPESIGGKLTIPYVCKDCNSKLGTAVDGKFQKLLCIELMRQIYNLTGKKGHCPNVFSGDWTVDDSDCPIKRVRIGNGAPEALPAIEIKKTSDGKSMAMAISSTLSYEEQRKRLEKAFRRIQLKVKPQLSDTPDKLDELVNSKVDKALHNAMFHLVRHLSSSKKDICSNAGVQEYVKIAYELAFCLYGYPYVTMSNTASSLRKVVFSGCEALKGVRRYFPFDFPKANDPFPDCELFFWIGEGKVFIRMFGVGGCIEVLDGKELIDFPPIDTYLSKLVVHSPDVQMGGGRCLWGQKLVKR